MKDANVFWNELAKSLPAIIPRKSVAKLTGGIYSRGYMANLDAKNLGPSSKMRIGKSICYERQNFIAWLRQRLEQ